MLVFDAREGAQKDKAIYMVDWPATLDPLRLRQVRLILSRGRRIPSSRIIEMMRKSRALVDKEREILGDTISFFSAESKGPKSYFSSESWRKVKTKLSETFLEEEIDGAIESYIAGFNQEAVRLDFIERKVRNKN